MLMSMMLIDSVNRRSRGIGLTSNLSTNIKGLKFLYFQIQYRTFFFLFSSQYTLRV